MGIRRKLEGDDIEVIKDLGNKRMQQEVNPRLQNRLAKGHIAAREKVRSLIPGSPASRVPQPKLVRNKTQLLIRKFRGPVLADILRVRVYSQGSASGRLDALR